MAGAPFKTECANILQINRSTVAAYLDANKLFHCASVQMII